MTGLEMVLVWAAGIALIVVVSRLFGTDGARSQSLPSPIDILQERFAKGEIDQKEYRERRRTLAEKF